MQTARVPLLSQSEIWLITEIFYQTILAEIECIVLVFSSEIISQADMKNLNLSW